MRAVQRVAASVRRVVGDQEALEQAKAARPGPVAAPVVVRVGARAVAAHRVRIPLVAPAADR